MGLFDFLKPKGNTSVSAVAPNPTLAQRLFGVSIPSTDNIEIPDMSGIDFSTEAAKENMPAINITASNQPEERYGGLFNDIAGGYKENRFNPISINNFGNNKISDNYNRDKGLAYRFGEGLGSIARIGESPLGRGLLTGAAIALMGGSPAEALAYGGTATALNQANRGRDTLYRQQLENEGIDTSNIKGYINDSTYKAMLEAKQLKDNAEYRNAYLESQKEQNKIANEFRRDQLERQAQQDELNNYYKGQQIAQGWQRISDAQRARAEVKAAKAQADTYGDIQSQLDNFARSFNKVNNPYRYRMLGGASEFLNTLTEDEANFNAQRTLLFNQIARKLGGEKGVLSDKDIQRVEAALPKLTDTLKQKQAKMDALYDLLEIKRGSANQAANNVMQVGNYTIEVE